MANGGIYDQIEGGFFRYTTDQDWVIPHFEKMLYTNAELIPLYVKMYLSKVCLSLFHLVKSQPLCHL